MIRLILLAALLLYATDAPAQDCPVRVVTCADPDDRSCPAQCRRDLSSLPIAVRRIPMDASTGGLWLGPPQLPALGRRTIVINAAQNACATKQSEHHERCHEAMYLATGNSKFHY